MTHFLSKLKVVVGSLVVFACFAEGASAAEAKETLHVGIYAPFTSNSAYIGRNMLGAMEIARDQLKSDEINYEFHTLDVIADKAHATSTLQKFIDAHHITVLVTDGSENGSVVAPLAKKNNLIHFCLTQDEVVADGKNNFLTKSAQHQHGAILSQAAHPRFVAQFKQEYFSQPVIEAGYAYDTFRLLNNSVVLAMKTHAGCSSKTIASNLLALESGTGLMGAYNLDKKGLAYKKQTHTV